MSIYYRRAEELANTWTKEYPQGKEKELLSEKTWEPYTEEKWKRAYNPAGLIFTVFKELIEAHNQLLLTFRPEKAPYYITHENAHESFKNFYWYWLGY